ncbi:AraC family transcriptional regulator [Acinetobacter zhairhuonensis]|uniref:AraC family transcriptional regulator n=1 Tax=Acinetobacter sp. A7.4 TaxID=2919921 RepID=UPI001F4E235E|nr:AraC family transcriptional regulator [Acinetobacter sp. A7.4]MCJ8160325.1 AraC family transcriptional regulator [Acinetobacter sp. A7.4]
MVFVDSIDFAQNKKAHRDMVHSSALRGYVDVMQQLGTDPMPLFDKHEISLADLQDENSWIKHTSLIQLLEESSQRANCPDLGLRISAHQDIRILGVLGVIMQSATTFREMIKFSTDLLFLHGPALQLHMNEQVADLLDQNHEVIEISFDIQPTQSVNIFSKRQSLDLGLAVCHRVLKYLSGEQYQLLKVALPHHPIASLNTYKRFFNADVVVGQSRAALYLHKSMLNIQFNSADRGLREIVDSYLEQSFRSQQGSIVERVQHAIRINLSSPKANKIDVAKLLAMHPRSLQRKLSESGTSFDEIKDQLRQQLFLQYLVDSKATMTQITSALGFSEQSTLSRACKKWFGMSPRELKIKVESSQPIKLVSEKAISFPNES